MTFNKFILSLIALCLFNAKIVSTELVIDPEVQPETKVCWAACADMMLIYYGNYPTLYGIWNRG